MKQKFISLFMVLVVLMLIVASQMNTYPVLRIVFLLLCIGGPLGMILLLQGPPQAWQQLLKKGGIVANAKVLNVTDTGMTLHKVNIGVRLTVEVMTDDGAAYEATIETFVSRVALPRVGDLISIVFNPNDKKEIAVVMQ